MVYLIESLDFPYFAGLGTFPVHPPWAKRPKG